MNENHWFRIPTETSFRSKIAASNSNYWIGTSRSVHSTEFSVTLYKKTPSFHFRQYRKSVFINAQFAFGIFFFVNIMKALSCKTTHEIKNQQGFFKLPIRNQMI